MDNILGDTNPQQAFIHAELERQSNDRIRVYNLLDEDFPITFDSHTWIVPARTKDTYNVGNGQRILPRYIARHYVSKVTDYILGNRMVSAVKKENASRIAKGMAAMNLWQEQEIFESNFRIDNMESRAKIANLVWLGVEEEFGLDAIKVDKPERRDPHNTDEEIMKQLQNRKAQPLNTLPTLDDLDNQVSVEPRADQIDVETEDANDQASQTDIGQAKDSILDDLV
jgi:hypothetical protein